MNTPDTIESHTLPNGLTILIQHMPAVQSAAYCLLVPAGSIYDQPGKNGTASVTCDMLTRGAGDYDSRQLAIAQDSLGLQSGESVQSKHIKFSGATLKDNLPQSLEILAEIVRRPQLKADQFSPALNSVRHSLLSIEDEPRQKVMIELKRRCEGLPWGKPTDGSLADLPNITLDDAQRHFESCFRPEETILGIAGNVDSQQVVETVSRLFGDWEQGTEPEVESAPAGPDRDHLELESTQTQIGLAYPSVSVDDPDYYTAWASVSILSGGSSSRLFTEVREKRGLCYAVYATLGSLKDSGHVLCYAGTTVDRAQETLDVMLEVIHNLSNNITEEELNRCKAGAKSALIMQQESSSGRASRIARDWFLRDRVVTLDEIHDKLDAITPQKISDYLSQHPAEHLTLLTIGPAALEIKS
ncbi:MAG: insulinase family protein [Planctomycetaceae bacterium]|nr:insulinase family protein [Planctomycetaceae bacterium]